MKNSFSIILVLLTGLFFVTACHKCVQCTEYNPLGAKAVEYPETCGKKQDIEDYRTLQENNVNPNNKVKCEERKTSLF